MAKEHMAESAPPNDGQPVVVTSTEVTQPQGRSLLHKLLNRGPKAVELVSPSDEQRLTKIKEELRAQERGEMTPGVPKSAQIVNTAGSKIEDQPAWGGKNPLESLKMLMVMSPDREHEPGDPNYLWSKEFRRDQIVLAREISDLESLSDEEKEELIDVDFTIRDRINQLFEAWKDTVDLMGDKMLKMVPFPTEEELAVEEAIARAPIPEQDFTGISPLKDVLSRDRRTIEQVGLESDYDYLINLTSLTGPQEAELTTIREHISRYFKEARRRDLLDEVDKELNSIYVEIREGLGSGLDLDEIMTGSERRQGLNGKIRELIEVSQRRFKTRRGNDNSLANLNGVSELYIQFTIDRFMTINQPGGMEKSSIEGGFNFAAENNAAYKAMSKHKELYWTPNYADYYTVTARTPEQFRIALDTFMMWVRTSLSKEPNEVFGKLKGFKDAITHAGTREGFDTTDMRQELEVLTGVIAGSHANEQYEEGNLTQLLMHTTQGGEGPPRWLQLPKGQKGKFAALAHKFDKDRRVELLFATYGSGGQLATRDAPIAQWKLRQQIIQDLTAEAMGIEIKGYHIDDPEKRLAEELNGKLDPTKINLDRVAMFQSDNDFKNLFEGFDLEDQERLYAELTERAEKFEQAKALEQRIEEGSAIEGSLSIDDFPPGEQALLRDHRDGKLELKLSEKRTLERLDRSRKIRQYLDLGGDPNELEGEDKSMWDEAKSAITLLMEVEGVTGEKAKRSGGAYIVHRLDSLNREIVEYLPPWECEAFVQMAENLTQVKYADAPILFLERAMADTRARAIEELLAHGRAAKVTDVDYDVVYRLATEDDKGKPYLDPQIEIVSMVQRPGVTTMMINRPKENPDGTVFKSPAGLVEVESVEVTFELAIGHILSRSTSHTYPGYQEENRELVLKEKSIRDAKLILQGILRPEDAYPPAVQLLILNPTLSHIAKFENDREREDLVALAAVEYSFQGANRISDEVFEAFEHNLSYNLQDDGGSTKTWEAFRLLVAQEPNRYLKRFRTKTAGMFLRFRSMADTWGAPRGLLDVFRMLNYPEYRMVGQQAMQKWFKQTGAAQKLLEAYTGTFNEQENKWEEGFSNKPKNNGDMVVQNRNDLTGIKTQEADYNRFLYKELETMGRLWGVSRAMFNLESVTRTDHAPLLLRKTDIFLRNIDGSYKVDASGKRIYNRQLDKDRDVGSARHDFHKFYYDYYIPWKRSENPDEAYDSYKTDKLYDDILELVMPASARVGEQETGDDFEFGKLVGSY